MILELFPLYIYDEIMDNTGYRWFMEELFTTPLLMWAMRSLIIENKIDFTFSQIVLIW